MVSRGKEEDVISSEQIPNSGIDEEGPSAYEALTPKRENPGPGVYLGVMKSEKYITRFDYERAKGWNVRLYQGKSTIVSKMFSDSIYGGKKLALTAAVKYRNQHLKILGGRENQRIPQLIAPPPGKITRKWIARRAGSYEVYEAYLKWGPKHNQQASTKWSIAVWGAKEAKRRCEVWMKHWLKKQAKAYGIDDAERAAIRAHVTEVRKSLQARNIERFENGWRLVLHQGEFHISRIFEDDRIGGRVKALAVTKLFEKEWLKAPKIKTPKGLVTWTLYWTSGAYYPYWTASHKGQTFRKSVDTYGYAKAKALCVQWLKTRKP